MAKVYITTAIPYMNGAPHIGHAMDYCLADTYARYQKLIGNEVRLQAGTDEHGNKIEQKARELGVPVKEYVDNNVASFKDFISKLGVEYTDLETLRYTGTDSYYLIGRNADGKVERLGGKADDPEIKIPGAFKYNEGAEDADLLPNSA